LKVEFNVDVNLVEPAAVIALVESISALRLDFGVIKF